MNSFQRIKRNNFYYQTENKEKMRSEDKEKLQTCDCRNKITTREWMADKERKIAQKNNTNDIIKKR